MKLSEEFRASRSVIVDVRRWQSEIIQFTKNLKNSLSTLGNLIRQSIESDKIEFGEFERQFSDFNDLVDSVRNELYSLEEIMEEINGCEILEGEGPAKAAKLIAKELKALETFSNVGESYAKALSLYIKFGEGKEMIPKSDLMSTLADLGQADQETQNEIDILCSSLEALHKHAEQLGERKVA
ncbi:MAG: hypothetical protein ACFFB3_20690 [Candidatus Hodarchaeota archaeon]